MATNHLDFQDSIACGIVFYFSHINDEYSLWRVSDRQEFTSRWCGKTCLNLQNPLMWEEQYELLHLDNATTALVSHRMSITVMCGMSLLEA